MDRRTYDHGESENRTKNKVQKTTKVTRRRMTTLRVTSLSRHCRITMIYVHNANGNFRPNIARGASDGIPLRNLKSSTQAGRI
mmetsp:Transcript_96381/g.201369  ORF Transcript_96381/g.201369 Transcript_96381/m.201369 type:complete len:83 (+) Transcript_96381:70-318(+)